VTSEPDATSSQLDGTVSGENLAAKRYAQAAFEIAREQGEVQAWRDGLNQIAVFMSDPEVRRVLENTRVGQEPKQNLIVTALGDTLPLALNLARLLVRKNRTALAPDIAGYFEQLMEQERGVSRVRAITAVPMNDAERDALTQRLREQTGNEVILQVEVDPSLLGGLVLQIGDRLIDASTRGRLQAMRESLVGSVA
jgi:F-type H+-transporting ATPase subunit delta